VVTRFVWGMGRLARPSRARAQLGSYRWSRPGLGFPIETGLGFPIEYEASASSSRPNAPQRKSMPIAQDDVLNALKQCYDPEIPVKHRRSRSDL